MTTRIYNYVKTAAPSSTDDGSAGYSVGDNWVDTTNDKIYRAIDVSNGAAKWLDGAPMYWGTTAPGSPIADDLWWETDTNILWYYTGSAWRSATLYTAHTGTITATSGGPLVYAGDNCPANGYDFYIADMYLFIHVVTTNNGSNYYDFDLRKVGTTTVPAVGVGTLLGTCSTSAITVDTWSRVTANINATISGDATPELVFFDNAKTGTPGNWWGSLSYTYRLVHP